MARSSTTQWDQLALNSLFDLVIRHVDCPMAVLTQHKADSELPEVIAISHMADSLAHGIAHSIQQAAAYDDWRSESTTLRCGHFDIENVHLPDRVRSARRITFSCPVDSASFLALSVCRFDTDEWAMRALAAQGIHSWVEAYLRLFWEAKLHRGRAAALAEGLDLFDFGTFLLDADGNIIFANVRALHFLELGNGLRRAGQSVTATDFDNAVRLQTAIHHLAHGQHSAATEIDGTSLILIQRVNARPLVAVVARLPDASPAHGSAAIALYVLDPDVDARPLATALCRAHGLTISETELVMRLVKGLTIDAAAREMHIQPQTARAYLKQIFAKTDTHRQTDLVRMILRGVVHIRPFAAPPSNGGTDFAHLRAGQTPVWG
ncbi:DNA-binding CsgD family transcriptional regulator [Novosphingobium sp. PhB165]|uniref:helix-turn-helix transcriptional regulator n=1 Tax=Novosphingobium sp. PhB165 TaxID=2485105 RepID=UPI0010486A65|nr:helix-turn-helix transcriptional regulator [Novosphingobium sp. PhB165]TCM16116.1 DNA-binding CsgD family transcriptional regulator [Novosphingobium sp. PhB165]